MPDLTPTPPTAPSELHPDVYTLGQALRARADEVLAMTLARAAGRDEAIDAIVRDRFRKINIGATTAVASWLTGGGPEAATEIGKETWLLYGELAAR
jgi:hypothetical protein